MWLTIELFLWWRLIQCAIEVIAFYLSFLLFLFESIQRWLIFVASDNKRVLLIHTISHKYLHAQIYHDLKCKLHWSPLLTTMTQLYCVASYIPSLSTRLLGKFPSSSAEINVGDLWTMYNQWKILLLRRYVIKSKQNRLLIT